LKTRAWSKAITPSNIPSEFPASLVPWSVDLHWGCAAATKKLHKAWKEQLHGFHCTGPALYFQTLAFIWSLPQLTAKCHTCTV